MTAPLPVDPISVVVDTAMAALADHAVLAVPGRPFSPGRYGAAQERIERNFEVPRTTISPIMRRFLFHIAYAARPKYLYGAGTYVGFAFSWLACGRLAAGKDFIAHGVDCDSAAVRTAARNADCLPLGDRLRYRVADALCDLERYANPIDLLFIDVDAPDARKSLYVEILDRAMGRLNTGALVLAHDPLVPIFADGFQAYFEYIEADERLGPTCVLPLDDCGISVTVVR